MVCFYTGERMIRVWTPDASLAPYISFDPRTGFLTFKPPRDEIEIVLLEDEPLDPIAEKEEEIRSIESDIAKEEAKPMVDVVFVEARKADLMWAQDKLAELKRMVAPKTHPNVMIDLTTSRPPALPQRNERFAINQFFPHPDFVRMAKTKWGLDENKPISDREKIADIWRSFLDTFDDFFSRYGQELQKSLRVYLMEGSDTAAKAKIRMILEHLLVRFQYPNRQYAILSHVAAEVYKDDKAKANTLREILVDLMQQYTAAKKAAGPSPPPPGVAPPRAAVVAPTRLHSLVIEWTLPAEVNGMIRVSMGSNSWDPATPIAFIDKTKKWQSVLVQQIQEWLIPQKTWHIAYPLAINSWTKALVIKDEDLPTPTKCETGGDDGFKFFPLSSERKERVFLVRDDNNAEMRVITIRTNAHSYWIAFAVYKERLVGLYLYHK